MKTRTNAILCLLAGCSVAPAFQFPEAGDAPQDRPDRVRADTALEAPLDAPGAPEAEAGGAITGDAPDSPQEPDRPLTGDAVGEAPEAGPEDAGEPPRDAPPEALEHCTGRDENRDRCDGVRCMLPGGYVRDPDRANTDRWCEWVRPSTDGWGTPLAEPGICIDISRDDVALPYRRTLTMHCQACYRNPDGVSVFCLCYDSTGSFLTGPHGVGDCDWF